MMSKQSGAIVSMCVHDQKIKMFPDLLVHKCAVINVSIRNGVVQVTMKHGDELLSEIILTQRNHL